MPGGPSNSFRDGLADLHRATNVAAADEAGVAIANHSGDAQVPARVVSLAVAGLGSQAHEVSSSGVGDHCVGRSCDRAWALSHTCVRHEHVQNTTRVSFQVYTKGRGSGPKPGPLAFCMTPTAVFAGTGAESCAGSDPTACGKIGASKSVWSFTKGGQ